MPASIDFTLVRGRGLRYISDLDRLDTVPEFKHEIKQILLKKFNKSYHRDCVSTCFIISIVLFFLFFTAAFFGARFVSKVSYALIGVCPLFIIFSCIYMCNVDKKRSKLIESACSEIDSCTNGCHRIDGKIFASRYVNNFKITTNQERLKKYKKQVAEGTITKRVVPPPKPKDVIPIIDRTPVQPILLPQPQPQPLSVGPDIPVYTDGMKVADLGKPTPGGLIPIINPNVNHRQTAPNLGGNNMPPQYPQYRPTLPNQQANFGAYMPPGQNIYYSDPNRINQINAGPDNVLPMYEINDPFDGPHTVRGSVNTNISNPINNNFKVPNAGLYAVPSQELKPIGDGKKQ